MSWREDLRAIIEHVPQDELLDLVGELVRGQAIVQQQLASPPPARAEAPARQESRLLKPSRVAKRLDVSPRWVYEHADELGAVKLGGALRIPERRLESYLKARRQ